ncbi:hypothetical protein MP228_009193 [Amoeboaphelidium protococcarum]|nr:hypothetical protein MP228_009193 [Amoeboaphelidium protococcarum]
MKPYYSFRTAFLVFSGLIAVIHTVQNVVNARVPLPYMDEIFHVRQTQQFCKGNFNDWDGKITTPPGLYYASVFFKWLAALSGDYNTECSLGFLRATNIVYTSLLYWSSLLYTGNPWAALNICLVPWLFFFNFLYYTDVASTGLIVFAMYQAKTRSYILSSAAVACSLMVRQTNIAWCLFIAGVSAIDLLSNGTKAHLTIVDFIISVLSNASALFQRLWSFVVVCICFLVFAFTNGGIAMGDKQNHVVSFHINQLMYFALLSIVLLSVSLKWVCAFQVLQKCVQSPFWFATQVLVVMLAIHYLSIDHPFLLSDNRHLSFYVWKVLRLNPMVKYLLAVPYVLSLRTLTAIMITETSLIWTCIFWLASAIALVPSPLFEFRYFMTPFVIMRLNLKLGNAAKLMETTLYALINFAVLRLFLTRTFQWDSEPGVDQRIMW